MDAKTERKLQRLEQQKNRIDKQLLRMKLKNKRKDLSYAYGNWASRCCNYPYESPTTYQEAVENVNILREFLGLPAVKIISFDERYFKPGYQMIVLGAEMKDIVKSGEIECPHRDPDYKFEMDENIAFLKKAYPSQAVFDEGYDYGIIAPEHIYSVNELHELGFPFNAFDVPDGEVEFTGKLVARMWAKKNPQLVCFFIAEDGTHYSLNVWWKDNERSYRPSKEAPSFKDEVQNGTNWRCTVTLTSEEKIVWSGAYPA